MNFCDRCGSTQTENCLNCGANDVVVSDNHYVLTINTDDRDGREEIKTFHLTAKNSSDLVSKALELDQKQKDIDRKEREKDNPTFKSATLGIFSLMLLCAVIFVWIPLLIKFVASWNW